MAVPAAAFAQFGQIVFHDGAGFCGNIRFQNFLKRGGGLFVLVVFGIKPPRFEQQAWIVGFGFQGRLKTVSRRAEIPFVPFLQRIGQMNQRGFVLRQFGVAGGELPHLVPLPRVEGVVNRAFQLFHRVADLVDCTVYHDVAVVFLRFPACLLRVQPAAFAVLLRLAAALVQQAAAFVCGIVGRGGEADRTERQEKQAEAVGHGMGPLGGEAV